MTGLLNQGQFTLIAIVIALAAYVVNVRTKIRDRMRDYQTELSELEAKMQAHPAAHDTAVNRYKKNRIPLRIKTLQRVHSSLNWADGILILLGLALGVRMVVWAWTGQTNGLADALIVTAMLLVGFGFSGLHAYAWLRGRRDLKQRVEDTLTYADTKGATTGDIAAALGGYATTSEIEKQLQSLATNKKGFFGEKQATVKKGGERWHLSKVTLAEDAAGDTSRIAGALGLDTTRLEIRDQIIAEMEQAITHYGQALDNVLSLLQDKLPDIATAKVQAAQEEARKAKALNREAQVRKQTLQAVEAGTKSARVN